MLKETSFTYNKDGAVVGIYRSLKADKYGVVTEAEIERRVVLARRAAKVREELAWAKAIHGTDEIWLDYLHERSVSADLNLAVCEPQ